VPRRAIAWIANAVYNEKYIALPMSHDDATIGQVEHPRWNVWTGSDPELICDTAALYGSGFGSVLSGPPSSCFVADGSAVIVRRGVPVR
jgi:hypothetical protein